MLDKTWLLYQKRIEEAIEHKNWRILGVIYYEMAKRVEAEGTDATYLKEKGYESKLRHLQEYLDYSNIELVTVQALHPPCSACFPIDGRELPAEDARLLNPIPVRECTKDGGCQCHYTPVDEGTAPGHRKEITLF